MRTDELTQAIHPQPVRPEPFDYAQDRLVEGLVQRFPMKQDTQHE